MSIGRRAGSTRAEQDKTRHKAKAREKRRDKHLDLLFTVARLADVVPRLRRRVRVRGRESPFLAVMVVFTLAVVLALAFQLMLVGDTVSVSGRARAGSGRGVEVHGRVGDRGRARGLLAVSSSSFRSGRVGGQQQLDFGLFARHGASFTNFG